MLSRIESKLGKSILTLYKRMYIVAYPLLDSSTYIAGRKRSATSLSCTIYRDVSPASVVGSQVS
jgi:hypothetical protein